MLNKILLTLLIMMNLIGLTAKHSDDFILGVFTYLKHNSNDLNTYLDHLQDAHYNCHVCDSNEVTATHLDSLYLNSDIRQLDIILRDRIWDEQNDVYGIDNLTRANNYKYEAEYFLLGQDPVGPIEYCSSQYYYRIPRPDSVLSFQSSVYDSTASHDNAWKCEVSNDNNSSPAFAAENLCWKWSNISLDKEIIVNPQDTLYYDFVMKIENPQQDSVVPVCSLNVFVWDDPDGKGGKSPQKHYLDIYSKSQSNDLKVEDFFDPSQTSYNTFVFHTPINSIPQNLIHNNSKLLNLNFEVYWHNNVDLYIDFFRVYDDIYTKLENGEFDNNIRNRVKNLSAENLKFLYSKDEPNAPQFEAYRIVKNKLSSLNVDMITAVARISSWMGGYTSITYNHHELFNTISESENIFFDYYPIEGKRIWNSIKYIENEKSVFNDYFNEYIQGRIDRMLVYYNNVRKIAADNKSDIPFIAIPQTYGKYFVEANKYGEHWGWTMLPPTAMQKCLQYLPLCYDAGGIIGYRFTSKYNYKLPGSNPAKPTMYHRLALIDKKDNKNGGNPIKTNQYYAIQQANEKISVYGPIIKNNLTWKGVGTIETKNNEMSFDASLADDLISVSVVDDSSGYYSGYVECAVYNKEETAENYFMLVNRRTNFSDSTHTDNDYAVGVKEDVNAAFTEANPQIVTFIFNKDNYSLMDVYDDKLYNHVQDSGNMINIKIEAGDGVLLKVVKNRDLAATVNDEKPKKNIFRRVLDFLLCR
jgi:hypothetical protein